MRQLFPGPGDDRGHLGRLGLDPQKGAGRERHLGLFVVLEDPDRHDSQQCTSGRISLRHPVLHLPPDIGGKMRVVSRPVRHPSTVGGHGAIMGLGRVRVKESRSESQKRCSRDSGQIRRSTLPTMDDSRMGPQYRLSHESVRLSPMT
jgi:hypothetical protein